MSSTLPNPLSSAAIARPDHLAVLHDGERTTYRTLDVLAGRIAAGLRRRGLGPGSVIAIDGAPSTPWIAALHAVGRVGAAAAPLDSRASPIERAQARSVLRADCTLGVDREDADLQVSSLLEPVPLEEERFWPLEETRLVLLTSGTTGSPRRVEITTGQIVFSALGSAVRLGHHLDDRWLACLPLHHIGGLMVLFRSALLATSVHLFARFDAAAAARAIDRGEVSLASFVPTMMERVLDARPPARFPPSLRAILLGGDRTPPALAEKLRAIEAPVSVTWGMSECASQIATQFPGELSLDHVGPPLPFARVGVREGRLEVRGPIAPRGVLLTSDRGSIRPEGTIEIHGRADEIFISGGENVDPASIELTLASHPDVARALVVALPDREWGQRPHALVVPRGGARPDLISFCENQLPPAAVPETIHWVDTLPLGTTGKPSREEARRLITQAPSTAPALASPEEAA